MFNILRKRKLQDWASQFWQAPVASMTIHYCIGLVAFALTLSSGKPLTIERVQQFESVTAPKFRLNILSATGAPTIDDIKLLEK
jgi:hypothetical protein